MAEVGPALTNSEARLISVARRRQEPDLTERHATSRSKTLQLPELDTALLDSTPTPSEPSPQPQSHEQSPNPEEQGQIREWHDGYRPARRQKKKPRPGESTFRVPMSMEQRKSLGASVRPKEPQGLGILNGHPVDTEAIAAAESPITPVTRGGTKLKFRAYGPAPVTIHSRNSDGPQLSPGLLTVQQSGMSEQPGNHYNQYLHPKNHPHDIDLLSAPLENAPKLAWWIAQQVSHTNFWQMQNNTISEVPEITASQFYGRDASGHDRRRQTNRQRKARWREANVEKNRDNDLRARVKRQAKAKFGDSETLEMNHWIATEFTKRRARRADRQISQAAKSGHFPYFTNSETIRNSLLQESMTYMLHPAVLQVRQLIIDVLFPAHDKADPHHRFKAIQILSEAIGLGQSRDDGLFRAAFMNIAQDEMAFNTIRSLMVQFEMEDDEEADHDGLSLTTSNGKPLIIDQTQSVLTNQVFTSLNQALTILTELKDFGGKQQVIWTKSSGMNGSTKPPSRREHRQYLKEFGMSELQLEEFLVLVNGGPLEPDPDDDLAVELHGNNLDIELATLPNLSITKTSNSASDSDIWDTINSVLEALLERCILPSKRGRHTKKNMMVENHAKNQAAKVKSLLMEIEIGGNRVRNRVESQAISEFYSRLTNFGKTQSFGGLLSQPQDQHHPTMPIDRSDILPESNVGRKRKYTDELSSVNQSPAAAMPLPNATNPFADDILVVPPPVSELTLSPTVNRHDPSNGAQLSRSPATIRQTLPPPSPIEPQIQAYNGYPQFRHTQAPEKFRS